jgi:hypothetical protein
MDVPKTTQRVLEHSPDHANRRIQEATLRSIEYYRKHPDEISERLKQLDNEWDIERVLEANASTLILAGLGLGLGVNKKFFAIPVVVGAFLLQHAMQGWCPPVSLLRRRGWRTEAEIDTERTALLDIRRGLH